MCEGSHYCVPRHEKAWYLVISPKNNSKINFIYYKISINSFNLFHTYSKYNTHTLSESTAQTSLTFNNKRKAGG